MSRQTSAEISALRPSSGQWGSSPPTPGADSQMLHSIPPSLTWPSSLNSALPMGCQAVSTSQSADPDGCASIAISCTAISIPQFASLLAAACNSRARPHPCPAIRASVLPASRLPVRRLATLEAGLAPGRNGHIYAGAAMRVKHVARIRSQDFIPWHVRGKQGRNTFLTNGFARNGLSATVDGAVHGRSGRLSCGKDVSAFARKS
jgi:hypothetical protein